MNRLSTYVIAASCLAVMLVASFACVSLGCLETADTCCVTSAHDDGPQATVKPAISVPAPQIGAAFVQLMMGPPTEYAALDHHLFSAGRPLRI